MVTRSSYEIDDNLIKIDFEKTENLSLRLKCCPATIWENPKTRITSDRHATTTTTIITVHICIYIYIYCIRIKCCRRWCDRQLSRVVSDQAPDTNAYYFQCVSFNILEKIMEILICLSMSLKQSTETAMNLMISKASSAASRFCKTLDEKKGKRELFEQRILPFYYFNLKGH